ncbi:MAG: hypothetical protein FWF59_03725 [Turicibacter sp.]|nr:hypothetical protein [Turicibacter sp.]
MEKLNRKKQLRHFLYYVLLVLLALNGLKWATHPFGLNLGQIFPIWYPKIFGGTSS